MVTDYFPAFTASEAQKKLPDFPKSAQNFRVLGWTF
jgi:hypothetical protein